MNPYREHIDIPALPKLIEKEHIYVPDWAKGNYYMIQTAATNISNVRVWSYHSKLNLIVEKVSGITGTMIVYVPICCDNFLSISYD